MERLIQYFETIPSSHRSLILVGDITFFWLVESAVPLFHFGQSDSSYRKAGHAGINIFFTLTTIVVNFVLAFILLKASDFVVAQKVEFCNGSTCRFGHRSSLGFCCWI